MKETLQKKQRLRIRLEILFGVTLETAIITTALTFIRPEVAILHLAAAMQYLLLIWQYCMLRRLKP